MQKKNTWENIAHVEVQPVEAKSVGPEGNRSEGLKMHGLLGSVPS